MIHICLATDDKYVTDCQTCIYSIIASKNDDTEVSFHVLGDRLSNPNSFDIFHDIPNVTIEMISVNSKKVMYVNRDYYTNDGNRSTYLRYIIPEIAELKNLDRILYLDSDIVVRKDLTDFYNTDMHDNWLAAPKNQWVLLRGAKSNTYICDYVNAGVLLMNLQKLREIHFTNKCIINTLNSGVNDEVMINEICRGKIELVSPIYNIQYSIMARKLPKSNDLEQFNEYYNTNYNSIEDILKDMAIMHLSALVNRKKEELNKPIFKKILSRMHDRLDRFIVSKQIEPINSNTDLDLITSYLHE